MTEQLWIGADILQALTAYKSAWNILIKENKLEQLDRTIIPTTLSLKVADKNRLFQQLQSVVDQIDQLHIGTVNNRFIASIFLTTTIEGLPILKILERRPGSDDPLGLDSLD